MVDSSSWNGASLDKCGGRAHGYARSRRTRVDDGRRPASAGLTRLRRAIQDGRLVRLVACVEWSLAEGSGAARAYRSETTVGVSGCAEGYSMRIATTSPAELAVPLPGPGPSLEVTDCSSSRSRKRADSPGGQRRPRSEGVEQELLVIKPLGIHRSRRRSSSPARPGGGVEAGAPSPHSSAHHRTV